MATTTSRPSVPYLFIRMSRIRLARIVMKIAGGLMTVAERLLPPDLRRDRLSPTTKGGARP
jgi:hypothetical protein